VQPSSYWTVSVQDFMAVWEYPEIQVTPQPKNVDSVERVTRWALVIDQSAYGQQ